MPSLKTTDGDTVDTAPGADTNKAFQQAMNAPAGGDQQAPPRREPKADGDQGAAPDPGATSRRRRSPRPDTARTAAKAPASLTDKQRADGVRGWAQVGGAFAMLGHKFTGNVALKADALTIVGAADEAADACVSLAQADPKFAAALDRVCAAGPYGVLIAVGMGVGSQCIRNHRPQLAIPGTVPPEQIIAAAEQEAARAAAAVPAAA